MRADDVVWTVLENDLAAIERARLEVRPLLAYGGLSAKTINRFEVVFEELIYNVIRYGFTPGSDQKILARVALTPDAVELLLEDDGLAFDPTAHPAPPPFESLETAQIGGLGIPTVRRFSRRFDYARAPADGEGREHVGRAFAPVNRVTVAIAMIA
ncbi:MAG TPA: ATP-binding protein [Caulobacteraceae bacterium]|jgi:serine/threonine-protein kinase RsbW